MTHTVIVQTEDDFHRSEEVDADAAADMLMVFAGQDITQLDIFPAGGKTPNIKRRNKAEAKEQDERDGIPKKTE